MISRNIKKLVKFAESEVIKENFSPILNEDSRKISIEEKFELIHKYNDIPLKYEKITTTSTAYFEEIMEKYFISTEGSEINESLITVEIRGRVTADKASPIFYMAF